MNVTKLVISFAVCFTVALAGSIVTTPEISGWYAELTKPDFTPPNYVFGPVWTILYGLMAMALYLIWLKDTKKKPVFKILSVFCLQLLLNLLWSQTFFGLHDPFLGFIVIVSLWASIAVLMFMAKNVSKQAAFLLLPYLIWVSYAMILNGAILVLNS